MMSLSGNPPVVRDQIRHARAERAAERTASAVPVHAAVGLVIEERVPLLSTFWGEPAAYVSRPDVRVRRQPVEVARLEVSSKAFCNATGVAPATEPIPRH